MLAANELFNTNYYLAQHPEVTTLIQNGSFTNAFDHFQRVGKSQGFDPSPLFHTQYYLANYPQVAEQVKQGAITAFDHFITYGQQADFNPSILFQHEDYYSFYPAVKENVDRDVLTGIEHFVKYGQFEGRRPSQNYNELYYKAKNPGLADALTANQLTGITHYIQFGASEGREVTPFMKPGSSDFPNGVAAGDTTQTSTVLWTRSLIPGEVTFSYSTDPNFNNIIGSKTTVATNPTVPVKVNINGLQPNTQYYYQVRNIEGTTATGQFKTAATIGTNNGLRFGVAADWQGQLAPYPAIANMPERNLDFLMLIGDTVYADDLSPDLPEVKQPRQLVEFRTKYNEVYGPRFGVNSWGDVRSQNNIYGTWDDHELTNDFAGGATAATSPQKEGIFGTGNQLVNETPVFKNAIRAFQEYLPIQEQFYGNTGEQRTAGKEKLYRYNTFGSDAATFLLDVRSFRDNSLKSIPETSDQATIDQFFQDTFNPNRTMLGKAQLADLKQDLLTADQAGITWKFVMSADPIQNLGLPVAGDRWEGYAAERTELLKFIQDNNIDNVVFVTGDFHGYVVNNVTYQEGPGQPQIPTNIIDVMTGPVAFQTNLGKGPIALPFGVATVTFAPPAILPAEEKERYQNLPTPQAKDQFVKELVNDRLTALGYSPIGLEDAGLNAQLLQGDYIAGHAYTWSEFEIDPNQDLTVTTYGVTPYTQPEIEDNPANIASQTPVIVSQFRLSPR